MQIKNWLLLGVSSCYANENCIGGNKPLFVKTRKALKAIEACEKYTGDLVIRITTKYNIEIHNLSSIHGSLIIAGDVHAVTFPDLTDISKKLTIFSKNVNEVYFPKLEEIKQNLQIHQSDQLKVVYFPVLNSVSAGLEISGPTGLKTLYFPSLVTVSDDIKLENLSSLSKVFFPSLKLFCKNLILKNLADLVEFGMPQLAPFGAKIEISAPNLSQLNLGEVVAEKGSSFKTNPSLIIELNKKVEFECQKYFEYVTSHIKETKTIQQPSINNQDDRTSKQHENASRIQKSNTDSAPSNTENNQNNQRSTAEKNKNQNNLNELPDTTKNQNSQRNIPDSTSSTSNSSKLTSLTNWNQLFLVMVISLVTLF